MDILAQLTEYKEKFESLQAQATQGNEALAIVAGLQEEKEKLSAELVEKDGILAAIGTKQAEVLAENESLKATIQAMQAEKMDSEAKAMEIVASIGMKEMPVIASPEAQESKPMSRNEALEAFSKITDTKAKGEFYKANQALLIGKR